MFVLTKENSVANHFLDELRDINIQKDRLRFRRNLERIGEILAYEISKTLAYEQRNLKTPLANHKGKKLSKQVVLANILRAAVPFHQGFLNYFDQAENAFVGAYRGKHQEDLSFEIVQNYVASPSIENKVLILIDPMLATGKSLIKTFKVLEEYGKPSEVHIAAVIAAEQGVNYVQENLTQAKLWIGAVDKELNQHSYIVPGLGDAGDLAFGEKS